jgi:hypothetical protein
MRDVCLLEDFWLALHVVDGEFICSHELETVDCELDDTAKLEILGIFLTLLPSP